MNKLLGFLGIIRRSGKMSLGFDASIDAINSSKSKLILISDEISDKTKENIIFVAKQKKVKTIILNLGISEIENVFNKKVGVLSINDLNMSKKIYTYEEYIKQIII